MSAIGRIWICLACVLLLASAAYGDAYDKSLNAYEKGDYSAAYKASGKAVKKTKKKADKAKLMALMGASSAKMGKKGKAKSLFVKALKLDPNLTLPGDMGRDKKVRKLFESAQDETGGGEDSFGSSTAKEGRGGKKGDRKAGRSEGRAPFMISDLAPFGLNAYMRGKYLVAGLSGGTQGLALVVYYLNSKDADDADKVAKKDFELAKAANVENEDSFKAYLSDNESFVKEKRQFASFALIGFFVTYGFSIFESMADPFHLESRVASSFEREALLPDRATAATLVRPASSWTFDLGLLPASDPMVYVALKTSF